MPAHTIRRLLFRSVGLVCLAQTVGLLSVPALGATTGVGLTHPPFPRSFEVLDLPGARNRPEDVIRGMLPNGVAESLRLCGAAAGGYRVGELSISLHTSWGPDEVIRAGDLHHLEFDIRVASKLFVGESPRIDLTLRGSRGVFESIPLSPADYLGESRFVWMVPELPPGAYQFCFHERVSGFCGTAEAVFVIAGESPDPTPSPTSTSPPAPTATPTRTLVLPTATPTQESQFPSPTPTSTRASIVIVENDIGPGTSPGSGLPAPFRKIDLPGLRQRPRPFSNSIAPRILETFGDTIPTALEPQRRRYQPSIRVFTSDDVSAPWNAGEVHTIEIEGRFSSRELAVHPPILDLLLVGAGGDFWIDSGQAVQVNDDPIHWTVPDLPTGWYTIHAVDRDTLQRYDSDLEFSVVRPLGPNPVPDYDGDGLITSSDLALFLGGYFDGNPIMDLDSEGGRNSRDVFQFARWWKRDAEDPPGGE